MGRVSVIDIDKVIPDKSKSIHDGAIVPLGKYKNQLIFWQIEAILQKYGFTIKSPVEKLSDEALDEVLYGSLEGAHR